MIAVVDYGMGNLRSVQKAFERLGHRAVVTHREDELCGAQAVVLPGVGAFQKAMANLTELRLDAAIKALVNAGRPFLGICLGLQLLFEESEEVFEEAREGQDAHTGAQAAGQTPPASRDAGGNEGKVPRLPRGLGLLPGRVVKFPRGLKVPQMGWNQLSVPGEIPLLAGVSDGSFVYFVHSYYVVPTDPSVVAATTEYGVEYASVVSLGNVFGIQFHPEKSSSVGLRILDNFGRMVAGRCG
ncbi:MAG: imidazole glycerol phosphate synthase subunit HisH [Firmicutes bacterium]|nr:imidazole glycerol phosphate synthase subunit HisH [Bacillota bacterium]